MTRYGILFHLVTLASLLAADPAAAHGITHTVERGQAVVVTLTYNNDTPFCFESCEIIPPGDAPPLQMGRTDRQGRIAFLPDSPGDWRVRAWSEDGHGVDLVVEVGEDGIWTPQQASATGGPTKLIMGISLLFGVFGILSLVLTRRRP